MRKILLVSWLLLPALVAGWHFGPGQDRLALDKAAAVLAQADRHSARGEWVEAEAKYEEALQRLPPGKVRESHRIRLERDQAQMLAHKLPEARKDLEGLVEELKADPAQDSQLLAEARSALANAQYYMTWLMRLEGQPREEWEPEIEAARQTYRLLAEQADDRGDGEAGRHCREDLESAVRLARMDLSDLQGLPLPSQ